MLYVGKPLFHAPACCLLCFTYQKVSLHQLKYPQHLNFKYLNWPWFDFKKCQIKEHHTCSQAFIEIPKQGKKTASRNNGLLASYMFLKLDNVHLKHSTYEHQKFKNTEHLQCKLLAEGTLEHRNTTLSRKPLILFGYLDIHVTYTHPSISW